MAGAYDVIVAGAGPAGSSAALRLSAAGARVLLLEKRRLGRDKPCGGGLTPRAWLPLDPSFLGMVDAEVRGVDIVRRSGPAVRMSLDDRPVLTVRRTAFDEHLARAAADAGAELRERESVESAACHTSGVTVRTARGEHRASLLLVATGAESDIPSSLGLPRTTSRIAVGVELEGRAQTRRDPAHILFDFHIPGGYAWAFPKGEMWNAGVLTVRRDAGRRLRTLLAQFIAEHGIVFDPAARIRGHRIPMQTRPAVVTRGRVAVLGDAAALADPFFGEGIAQALLSGRAAADAALDVLRGDAADMRAYQRGVATMLWPHARRMRLVARGVYHAPGAATRLLALAPSRALARRWATQPFSGDAVRPTPPASMAVC